LKLAGYGQGHPANGDGTYQLSLGKGSTVRDVIRSLGVPLEQVTLTMVNARQCQTGTKVQPGDRVILVPPDVACLWRFLGLQNLGADSVCDF
jgi:hypothetical protein